MANGCHTGVRRRDISIVRESSFDSAELAGELLRWHLYMTKVDRGSYGCMTGQFSWYKHQRILWLAMGKKRISPCVCSFTHSFICPSNMECHPSDGNSCTSERGKRGMITDLGPGSRGCWETDRKKQRASGGREYHGGTAWQGSFLSQVGYLPGFLPSHTHVCHKLSMLPPGAIQRL